MEVILLQKIANLGGLGDQVTVKPGYGRNYLIPQGKAVSATRENKTRFEAQRAELEKAAADTFTSAQSRAEKIEGLTVQILRKSGEEGKLFGSVGTADIAEAATQAGFALAKSEIHLSQGPLKEIGDHEVTVSLHPEVHCKIIVSIVREA